MTGPEDLPDGDYAVVELMGHNVLIGRIAEVERFGAKMIQVEPLYAGEMLGPVLHGGASIYGVAPCTKAAAWRRMPTETYQLPAAIRATIAPAALTVDAESIKEYIAPASPEWPRKAYQDPDDEETIF